MKAQIKCKCGKVLGYYEGEDFYIVSENGAWASLIQPKVKILCSQCWDKTKSHSYDSATVMKRKRKRG